MKRVLMLLGIAVAAIGLACLLAGSVMFLLFLIKGGEAPGWTFLPGSLVFMSLGVFLAAFVVSCHRRELRRQSEWCCRRCGRPFGLRSVKRGRRWRKGSRVLFALVFALKAWLEVEVADKDLPESGPLLHCEHCNKEFRFTNGGEVLTKVKRIAAGGTAREGEKKEVESRDKINPG
jgi:hypothetical protein